MSLRTVVLGLIVAACTLADPTIAVVSPYKLEFLNEAQNFTVPVNVSHLLVTLYGGSGQNNTYYLYPNGGRGSMISAFVPVMPGEILRLMVGQSGTGNVRGAFNGGGRGAEICGGGGGATDIRRAPYTLADRVLVAGGGGGGGFNLDSLGGDGGIEATMYAYFVSVYLTNCKTLYIKFLFYLQWCTWFSA